MRRLILVSLVCSCALFAQQKKILVMGGDAEMIKEYESATPKAMIVPVTKATVMKEIVDATPSSAPSPRSRCAPVRS
jgi:hypothetical protein